MLSPGRFYLFCSSLLLKMESALTHFCVDLCEPREKELVSQKKGEPCVPVQALNKQESKNCISQGDDLNEAELWPLTPNRGRK